jgi:hypothetical protein
MKASVPAAAAGMIDVGGDLTVARLGYGAMRITGPGVWGEPPDRDRAERVTPVVSVQNVAAAGLELRPDEVTAVTSRPDAGILGLPRGLARNRRARTPRLPAAARPEHRSMSTE